MENMRSARCLRIVLFKLLAARKLEANFFISARARKKVAVLACSRILAKTIRHPRCSLALPILKLELTVL